MVAPDVLEQIGMEGAMDNLALPVRRALRPEQARLADRGTGTIQLPLVPSVSVAKGEDLAVRTVIDIVLRVVGELGALEIGEDGSQSGSGVYMRMPAPSMACRFATVP